MNKKIRHSLMLVLTAFIWGIAFVAQSEGGNALGPYTFNCVRSFIGGSALLPVIFFLDKKEITKRRPENKREWKRLIKAGTLCGVALFLASTLQQLGLFYGTKAGKAGFLTACYILIVPILGLFLKKKCGINIWIGVVLALVGLYFLCGNGELSLQASDGLVLGCSFLFSVQIMLVDHYAPEVEGVRLSCIQFYVTGLLGLVPMIFLELKCFRGEAVQQWLKGFSTTGAWVTLLYAGILSCGVAYTFQILGQVGLNPAIASLLMSLESMFSVLAGWIILGQALSKMEIAGCVIMFVAIMLAQIPVTNFFGNKE